MPDSEGRLLQENLWTGEPELAPEGHLSVVLAACCGYCDPTFVECVAPFLQVLLVAAAATCCVHTTLPHQPCPTCSDLLLLAAERMRASGTWEPHSLDLEVSQALADAVELGLIDQHIATALYEGFDTDNEDHWPETYLAQHLIPAAGDVTLQDVQRAIDLAQARATTPDRPRTARRDGNWPPRAAYHRAEPEIAERHGLPDLPRFMVEQAVRDAAVAALTEADFVRLAYGSGLRLIPRTSPAEPGVVAHSAILTSLPDTVQREYGARELARDLILDELRLSWDSEPDTAPMQAWATWLHYTGAQTLHALPHGATTGDSPDIGWRWRHPDTDQNLPVPDVRPVPTSATARRDLAREILLAGQGGACAMCSIQYYTWRSVRPGAGACPMLRAPLHLDHDHVTGLIRGLLCNPCNTLREPAGAASGQDTWSAYVAHPPAVDLGCQWPYN
jgi:hypothetical protein